MKYADKLISGFLLILLVAGANLLKGEEKSVVTKTDNQRANDHCLKCHAHNHFIYENTVAKKQVKHKMEPGLRIDTVLFYQSNHKNFKCTDCHSEDFGKWPHSAEVRMETPMLCLDCHGGDEKYAKFQFEKIEAEFAQSTHATRHGDSFSCWTCHEPHTYKISARNDSVINKIIAYDNNICLSCHNNVNKFELISDNAKPNIIAKHDWLPNQARHFQNVRCIECHAHKKDSLLVAHNIMPKEKAVKLCQECHSKNSILMNSLYQYQLKSKATGLGFDNEKMLDNSYVIGANRNIYLNRISIAIFLLTLIGIAVHTLLRIIFKKH
ncbi:MAG: cytochrome c3 family protein [Marinilabiliales bacterium]|nr:cytochrome c3 family protein [Marinilabiliales bacterium]